MAEQKQESIGEIVRKLLDEPLALETDETVASLTLQTLKTSRFVGQVVRDGETIVYASILASKRWLRDRRWQQAKPFEI